MRRGAAPRTPMIPVITLASVRWPSRLVTVLLLPAALAVSLFAQAPDEKAAPAAPVFLDGQAQEVPAFKNPKEWIREHLWVEASFDSDGDGTKDRMHVDVTRQKQTDTEGLKVPVIYETSPYFAGTGGNDASVFWDPKHELGAKPPRHKSPPPIPFNPDRSRISEEEVRTWVPRGFAVVHSESPGTGQSTGCPTVGAENEKLAPKAVIDWLNGRAKGYTTIDGKTEIKASWCTGKVGMIGTSYNGTLPLACATTGVEGLMAIVPISPNTSYYHYYRANGLVRHPGGYMGEDVDVLYDFIHSGDPARRDWCNEHVRDQEMIKNQDRVTGDMNDWWAARDYKNQLGPLTAAVLMAHGFNDWNVMPEHTVRIYAELKNKNIPCMAYFHQGGHGGPPPMPMVNRWFSRFLYGIKNDIETGQKAWIVREGDKPSEPTGYADYPNPDAAPVTLHLSAGGNTVGDLSIEAKAGHKIEHLTDDVAITGTKLAQAEKSENRLIYATAPLSAPLHLSGTARVTVRLASSKAAANLSIWLVELPWIERSKINDNLITRGWADPQNYRSQTKGEPLKPGKFVDVTFALEPDDQIIAKGRRIALMIFASDRDFTLWPKAGTELQIDLDGTTLELPVVFGKAAFEAAVAADAKQAAGAAK